jgi:hypothetical protein
MNALLLGAILLDTRGWLEDGMAELCGGIALELTGTLDGGIPELADGMPELCDGIALELAGALDAEPLIDPDPTPSVPSGALGSLGAYVVNIDSGPQAGPLDVDVMVVPLRSHPVRVLKLYHHTNC